MMLPKINFQHLFLCVIIATISACTSQPKDAAEQVNIATVSTKADDLFEEEQKAVDKRRSLIFKSLPTATTTIDSAQLVKELCKAYDLNSWTGATLSNYQFNSIYGAKDSIYFLELKKEGNKDSCDGFEAHYQLIFNKKGQLIYEDSAHVAELKKVWKAQSPILMTIQGNCQGEAQHHFYLYKEGILIDIFNVLMENTAATFDNNAEGDGIVYHPKQLKLTLKDLNQDGWEDLVFEGKKLWLKGPDSTKKYYRWQPYQQEQVSYEYLFYPNEEWFLIQNNKEK